MMPVAVVTYVVIIMSKLCTSYALIVRCQISVSGSQLYNYSLYLMGATLFVLFCFMMLLLWKAYTNKESHLLSLHNIFYTLCWGKDKDIHSSCQIETIFHFYSEFWGHIRFILFLVIVVIVASLPIYFLRLVDTDNTFSSHWNTYSWTLSLSYLDGSLMGILVFCVWVLAASAYFFFYISSIEKSGDQDLIANVPVGDVDDLRKWNCRIILAFIANLFVTLLVNTLYILSTTDLTLSLSISIIIRIGVAAFRLINSAVIVPFLANHLTTPQRKSLFMLRLLMLNNLIIPCLVTALTSSNCFQVLAKLYASKCQIFNFD